MIRHHPAAELLLDYAAGSLPEPVALAIASHAALCPECREAVETCERLGGALLEGVAPEDLDDRSLAAVLARLDEPAPPVMAPPRVDGETAALVPKPLLGYLGRSLGDLPWRRLGRHLRETPVFTGVKGFRVSLMRWQAGSVVPRHVHQGAEFTMVLAGGFRDGDALVGPGDLVLKEKSDEHQPLVDDDDACLCLVVLAAPVKLTGRMGRLLNPFLRF